MCVRASACELAEVCVCLSTAGDPCRAPTSDRVSEGTSGFRRRQPLSFGWSDLEEEGSWDVEDTAGGGSVEKESTAGLGLIREDVAEVEKEEDVDRKGDGDEVEDGVGAKEERRGVTAEGDKEEEDLEIGDLGGGEEELVLEDVVLLRE